MVYVVCLPSVDYVTIVTILSIGALRERYTVTRLHSIEGRVGTPGGADAFLLQESTTKLHLRCT